jgi:pimeloyl-ACP methyl ester carboxylesterase
MQLRVNGTTLSCETLGEGPPYLCLHGGPGTGSSGLRRSLAPLAEALGVRLVFYDHRGHGRSEWVPVEQCTQDQLVADVEGVREALGLGRVRVLGISWGGFLALMSAARLRRVLHEHARELRIGALALGDDGGASRLLEELVHARVLVVREVPALPLARVPDRVREGIGVVVIRPADHDALEVRREEKSRSNTAPTASRPMPGQANTVSVSTAPPTSVGSARPTTVTTGISALRSAWRQTTGPPARPLARAVRT